MPKRPSEEYASQVATEDAPRISADFEQQQAQGNGSSEASQTEVVRLLAAILTQVRGESLLRPPQLTPAAQEAIRLYGIMSAAMSPTQRPPVGNPSRA